MPPPMSNPTKRMTANPARPVARYRPGKGAQEEDSSEEDEDEEEEQVTTQRKPPAKPVQPPRAPILAPDEDEEEDEEGFVTDEEDEIQDAKTSVYLKPAEAKSMTQATQITEQVHMETKPVAGRPRHTSTDEEEDESDDEEDEDDSVEEESSSEEEEAPQRKFQRPTFIKKTDRKAQEVSASVNVSSAAETTTDDIARSATESSKNAEVDEQARRLAQADLMIKDKLERDAIARAAGKKAWDDDDDLAPEELVDDTDGLDPDAEYAAWRLRELQRLKRDRETMIAREKEIEEIERRRNLTAEEREKEDRDFLEKQKAEREEGRSQGNYLSKYHHKGAFFQDDEAAEVLRKRDLMGAKFADDVSDKSTLPEYMRIRDMTKLGKKGRTRYTDLKGQDTGRFGDEVKRWKGSGYDNLRQGSDGADMRGVDERFLPDRDREVGGPTASGANASAVGVRKRRSRSRSPKHDRPSSRERGGDSYRPAPRRRSYSRSSSRSISRSPPPRRRRSRSPQYDRDRDRDKRRRIET